MVSVQMPKSKMAAAAILDLNLVRISLIGCVSMVLRNICANGNPSTTKLTFT